MTKVAKKIAIMYGGPDDEYNFYGDKVKEVLEKIDREKYEPVQIFITKDLSFKIFNPKHTNKKLFFSENKIFNFLKDKNIKEVILLLIGEYGDEKILENKLKENNIEIKSVEDIISSNI